MIMIFPQSTKSHHVVDNSCIFQTVLMNDLEVVMCTRYVHACCWVAILWTCTQYLNLDRLIHTETSGWCFYSIANNKKKCAIYFHLLLFY